MKIYFGHHVENTTPSTKLPRDFCAGIGPQQLGVVLLSFSISHFAIYSLSLGTHNNICSHSVKNTSSVCIESNITLLSFKKSGSSCCFNQILHD